MTTVSQRVEILQSGEAARQDNPPCNHSGTNAGEIILKATAAAIDAYIGQPFVSNALNQVPAGNQQWVKDRLGISNGQSCCSTVVLVLPRDASPTFTITFTETGGDGRSEHSSQNVDALNGSYGTGWCAVESASIALTDKSKVFSVTGKNWSHNRNRWFEVKADY